MRPWSIPVLKWRSSFELKCKHILCHLHTSLIHPEPWAFEAVFLCSRTGRCSGTGPGVTEWALCAHPAGLGSSVPIQRAGELCAHCACVCVWPPGQTLELRKGDSARKCWSNRNATRCTGWGRLFSAATWLWPLLNCPAFHQPVMLVKYSS